MHSLSPPSPPPPPLPLSLSLSGGETVRQLQIQSGAHIELCRGMQPNPHEKFFNIRGDPQQIQIAQQLIRQKCDMVRREREG